MRLYFVDTRAAQRHLDAGVHPRSSSMRKSAYIFVYSTAKYTADPPRSWKDFFDTKAFPGKRGMMMASLVVSV
jgi:hypothetical protein